MPAQLTGGFIDSSNFLADPEALRASLQENGYLLLRGAIARATALAARRELLQRLVSVGEIDLSWETFSGNSQRPTGEPQAGDFLRSVCDGPLLRAVTANPRLADIISSAPVLCSTPPRWRAR